MIKNPGFLHYCGYAHGQIWLWMFRSKICFEVIADKKEWTVRWHYIARCFYVLETFKKGLQKHLLTVNVICHLYVMGNSSMDWDRNGAFLWVELLVFILYVFVNIIKISNCLLQKFLNSSNTKIYYKNSL